MIENIKYWKGVDKPVHRIENHYSCDLVVVGSGVSGLCAAVQAANTGKEVIMLESLPRAGGNWNGSYGMMAVDSVLARKQGVEVDANALMNQEIRLFNFQVDSKLWMDMVQMSGENVSWLMEQGVEFEEKLEPYTAGEINAPVMHLWARASQPSKKMLDTFEKAGGIVLLNTKAKKLLFMENAVSGVIAETKDGQELLISCKAVISAGGGYAKNPQMVSRILGRTDYACRAAAANDGSAIQMCIEGGAKSTLAQGNQIVDLIPREMKKVSHWLNYIHSRPGSYPFHVNVNQDGERYVNEACTLKLYAFSPAAAYTQERTYTIYDEQMLKDLEAANNNEVFKMLRTAAEEGTEGVFRADSFEELADKLGLEPKHFAVTMRQYNQYCENGKDPDYEKTPEFLRKFNHPPFYGWENGYQVCATIGGLDYNRKMEVISDDNETIPGLYVAGVDGAKLYRDYYSLAIPGSCNANNVYSGRMAAINAMNYISLQR